MPILTKEQIERLAEIIRQHATWLTWRIFGTRYVTEADLQKLKAAGKLPMDVQVDAIKYAFVLGKLEALLTEAEWKGLQWDDLVNAASATHTDVENLQIEASELSAHTVLRGLEDDIRNGLYESLATVTQRTIDEAYVKEIVRDEVKVGVEMSRNFRAVAREMAEKTGEYKRNWHRVAVTEMHAARQNGTVSAILNKIDVYEYAEGEDSQVSVVPDAAACSDCKRIYLDQKGNPRVFRLSELLGNSGSNYVRPWRQNAKAVVPPLHPNCFCRIRYIPGGWGWEEGKMVLKDPAKVVERARARMSKIEKSIEILKAHPHQLLQESKEVSMPTQEDVDGAMTPGSIHRILDKILALRKIHQRDPEMWERLDDLEKQALQRAYQLDEQPEVPHV